MKPSERHLRSRGVIVDILHWAGDIGHYQVNTMKRPYDSFTFLKQKRKLLRRLDAMRDDLVKHRDSIQRLYEKQTGFPTAADLVIEKSNWLIQEINKRLIKNGQ